MVSTRRAPAPLNNAATAVDSQPSTSATNTSSRARRGAQDKTKKATKGRDVSAAREEAVEEAGILDGAAAQDSKSEGEPFRAAAHCMHACITACGLLPFLARQPAYGHGMHAFGMHVLDCRMAQHTPALTSIARVCGLARMQAPTLSSKAAPAMWLGATATAAAAPLTSMTMAMMTC